MAQGVVRGCSCCAEVPVVEPFIVDRKHDTQTRDILARAAAQLEQKRKAQPEVAANMRHLCWRHLNAFFSIKAYARLAPACIQAEWLPPKSRPRGYPPLPSKPAAPAVQPQIVPSLVEPAVPIEPTAPAEPATSTEPAEPDENSSAAVIQVLAAPMPDLRGKIHTEGYVRMMPVGQQPVDLAHLEASLYKSTSWYDPDGAITIDKQTEPERESWSIQPELRNHLRTQMLTDFQQHNLVGNRDRLELKAIISEPGPEQPPHTDDATPSHDVYQKYYHCDDVLLAGICAVMPGTKIIIYPKGKDGPRVPLDLEMGEYVIFRGDCWHCGAKYDQRNVRLHFYLSSPKRRREKGYTAS